MRKNILAIVFMVTALIQNIASAADYNSVDWNNAPHFSNKADFIRYIQACEKNCKAYIPVVFASNVFINTDEILKIYKNAQQANITWWSDRKGGSVKTLYELHIYPGAKVEYAYRTGDISILSNEERKLYNYAIKIVKEAKKFPTPLRKEHYIHEKITERTTYYTANTGETLPRHCTAIGALLDGKANCQGYTDAFYMLGRMAGLNVGKMSGNAAGGAHTWNTINFGDGRTYAVDVTFDDASFRSAGVGEYNTYIYFNAPLEILNTSHTWEAAYNPTIYPKIDSRYFYTTQEFSNTHGQYFGFSTKTAENALQYIAQRISKGYRLSWAMAPYAKNYADTKFSLNRLVREILPNQYNWYGSAKMSVAHRGNWIFYTVDATKN